MSIIDPSPNPKYGWCDYIALDGTHCKATANILITRTIHKDSKIKAVERKCQEHFNLTRKSHDKRE